MQRYKLTQLAEADLLEVWRYTAKHWGRNQADHYFHSMEGCCRDIVSGTVRGRQILLMQRWVYSVRCGRHYIFFLNGDMPLIIGILHEKMDFLARLERRLR